MSSQADAINYEELVDLYWNNLNEVLRGFNVEKEFLQIWVPDEDLVKSVANLLESASLNSEPGLAIRFQKSTVGDRQDEILEIVNELAKGEFKADGDSHLILAVTDLQ